MNGRQGICCVAIVLVLATAGCGKSRPALGQVTGKVTLQGEPVEGAAVMFVPQAGGRTATGVTNAAGEYRLTTFDPEDGALVGRCNVAISKQVISGATADDQGLSGPPGPGGVVKRSLLPEQLASPKDSGLTAEVKPGPNRCDFEL